MRRTVVFLLAGALVAAGGFAAARTAVEPTAATWTDATFAVASASAGTWAQGGGQAPVGAHPNVVEAVNATLTGLTWYFDTPNTKYCFEASLTGLGTEPLPWELRLRLDLPPFNGSPADHFYYEGATQVDVSAVPGEPTLGRVTGRHNQWNPWNPQWNNATLTAAQQLTIRVCNSRPTMPVPGDASWYTVTPAATAAWQPTLACVAIAATPVVAPDTHPPYFGYFFGWTGQIDLAAAKAYITSQGRTVNYVSWSPGHAIEPHWFLTDPGVYQPVADTYTITSGRMTAIRRGVDVTVPATVTACVHGY